ncbi:MAG: flippase-like domain-containing protein, partial [Planctomycetes bacterium]|nr:flippase-like domain-containing protein [Planctomycetota bacterium]
ETERLHSFATFMCVVVSCAALGFALLYFKGKAIMAWLRTLLGKLPFGEKVEGFVDALDSYHGQFPVLVSAFIIGLVSHLASIFACVLLGMAAGVEGMPVALYFLLVPVGFTVNAMPGAPGGLGQGEIAFANLFFLATGVDACREAGVSVMICYRVGLILISFIGGILYAMGKHSIDNAVMRAELDGEEVKDGIAATAGETA